MTVKTKVFALATLLVLLLSIGSVVQAGGDDCCGPCTGTPGYWKNHPEVWPDGVTIGDIHYSTQAAIAIMDDPVKGDKTITLFKALVAAKLNRDVNGCCVWCIWPEIHAGDDWMKLHAPGSGVQASSDAWQCGGEDIYLALDAYNNGWLECADARD